MARYHFQFGQLNSWLLYSHCEFLFFGSIMEYYMFIEHVSHQRFIMDLYFIFIAFPLRVITLWNRWKSGSKTKQNFGWIFEGLIFFIVPYSILMSLTSIFFPFWVFQTRRHCAVNWTVNNNIFSALTQSEQFSKFLQFHFSFKLGPLEKSGIYAAHFAKCCRLLIQNW